MPVRRPGSSASTARAARGRRRAAGGAGSAPKTPMASRSARSFSSARSSDSSEGPMSRSHAVLHRRAQLRGERAHWGFVTTREASSPVTSSSGRASCTRSTLLGLAAQQRQHAVRGRLGQRLLVVAVVARTWWSRPSSRRPRPSAGGPCCTHSSRALRRRPASSATRSAQMSRAPASAASRSGTSLSGLHERAHPRGHAPRRAAPPASRCRSASGSSPRSRAMAARVRRLGLYGR